MTLAAPAAPLPRALACATIAASEPAALVALLRDALGWRICAEGALDASLEACWGIAARSAGAYFWLLASPGADRGMIRVVQGADRWPARPIGARWSGVEIVVAEGIDELAARLASRPDFRLLKAPRSADFTSAGSNVHRFFHGRGPGGTHFMFTMAVTQARDRAFTAAMAPIGHVFAAPLVTADFNASRNFYREVLGMVPILQASMRTGLWHESWDLADGTPVELEILRGDAPGTGLGHIELQGYEARWIDAVEARADRFDGGASLVTFTVADIESAWRRLRGLPGVHACTAEPRPLAAAPYAGGRSFCFIAPGGERIELCERWTVRN
ncbi:MAG: VOC family protein [Steroidobacteraceae bacterium]